MINSIVCYDENCFSGWPANGGMWIWGNEILVSYNRGSFDPLANFHRIGKGLKLNIFSRSADGGLTWSEDIFDNSIYKSPLKEIPESGFDFAREGFAMRFGQPAVTILTNVFIVTYDKGITWDGPYRFPDYQYTLTSRTSYMVEDNKNLYAFMSYSLLPELNPHGYTDRAFVSETTDGGVTWQFTGEITNDEPRSVMPITVKMKCDTLVTALRRRMKRPDSSIDDVWIEVKRSDNNGKTWHSAVRAADTYNYYNPSNSNGNPPAMCILPDETIVLAYGRREPGHSAIYFKISKDGGRSFINETCLRDDPISEDMGYPRIVVRPDGICVAAYYIATKERPIQHIEATVFDPLK